MFASSKEHIYATPNELSTATSSCGLNMTHCSSTTSIALFLDNPQWLIYQKQKKPNQILPYHFYRGNRANIPEKCIKITYGDDVMSERACRKLFSRFLKGTFSLKNM